MKAIEVTGKVNAEGQILLDKPLDVTNCDRIRVIVLLEDNDASPNSQEKLNHVAGSDWDKLRQLIKDYSVDAGIEDLAHQHDHYLYGTPKRDL